MALILGDDLCDAAEYLGHDVLQVLGIERLGQRSVAAQVREEYGHGSAFGWLAGADRFCGIGQGFGRVGFDVYAEAGLCTRVRLPHLIADNSEEANRRDGSEHTTQGARAPAEAHQDFPAVWIGLTVLRAS